jgi:hypothetical protein
MLEQLISLIVRYIFGGLLINLIGGSTRWAFGTTWRKLTNQKTFKYREYIYGPENSEDWFDRGHWFVNFLVFLIVVLVFYLSLETIIN